MNDKTLLESLKPGQALNIDAQVLPVFIAWLLHRWEDFGPHILISHQQNLLKQIQQNLLFFEQHQQIHFMENMAPSSPDELNLSLQKEALQSRWLYKALLAHSSDVFMTDFSNLIHKTRSPVEFKEQFISLKSGTILSSDFFQKLQSLGWQERERVELMGEFSQRGMILDLFSPARDKPVRLELMGWEVGQIKELDPVTQISKNTIDEVVILPFSPCVSSKKSVSRLEYFKQVPLLWVLSDLQNKQFIEKIFINKLRFLIFNNSFYSSLGNLSIAEEWKKNRLSFSCLRFPLHFFKGERGLEKIKEQRKKSSIFISSEFEEERKAMVLEMESKGLRLKPEDLWPVMQQEQNEHQQTLHIINRPISESLQITTEDKVVCFLKNISLTTQKVSPAFIENKQAGHFNFAELIPGDSVVHKQYGIGQFQKLDVLHFGKNQQEFLVLKYKEGDLLYVPVYALQQVQKYIGSLSGDFLDKLGGERWLKTQDRVKKRLREMTGELLKLYSQRNKIQRTPFSFPGETFKQFEAEFPFIETPDQRKAIQEVLEDLTEKTSPCDRLICGDVGYGKTEVAIRACFKVIEDGFQACVLAPTTLLSFQHFERFKERFKNQAVRIGLLNRFTFKKEKIKTLEEIKSGTIDILIGTHKILSKEIYFKKLGLFIIDEEHLFGVRSKEKLKKWQTSLDTVSLSATPIPRSLSMSLSGLRNISLINTPPLNRKSIKTFINTYNLILIKEAVLKELSRQGQVIFIHNRISDIRVVEEQIKQIVPSARIRVAHGKMKTLQKNIVLDFFYRKFDVLICTTIMESGMDFPMAGTLFINNSDEFGLSQLHQLRGRIGRSDRQSICYLLVKSNRNLTEQAKERLRIIQENNQPGAGLAIARYDLEMRGAGDLMGAEQSGFLKDLGFEMYFELLQESLSDLKGEEKPPALEPEIHFKKPAYLPKDYIPHEKTRLIFYKKFSVVENKEDLNKVVFELENFAGLLPEEALNFVLISQIRILAKKWHIRELSYKKPWVYMNFADTTPLQVSDLLDWIKKGVCETQTKNTFRFSMEEEDLQKILDLLRSF